MSKLKWETMGSENQNFVIKGEDGNTALLVFKTDRRETKKLNKVSRKFEKVIIPEQWSVVFSLIQVHRYHDFLSEKEAIDFAEDIFIQAVEKIEDILIFVKDKILN